MTKVAFKVSVNPYTKEKEVFAFFPMEKDRHNGDNFTSYSHVGQHSLCAKSYFDRRRWATYSEYIDLYKELVNLVGYHDLKVLNKDFNDYDEDGCYIADSFGLHVNSIEAQVS